MEAIKTKEIGCAEIVKEVNKEDMIITHYISTRTPDRYDEVMNPKGCDDTEYRKNPVVFFGHRARDLPIAKNIKLSADDYGVIAVTKFDSSEFAKEVFRLNTEGFLNSWSIGFVPMEQPEVKDKYLYYERWKLLEYSSVPIPANPDAVNLMLKDIRDEKVKEVIEEHNYRMIRMKEVEDMIMQKIREYADTTLERSIEERAGGLERSINEQIERKWNEIIEKCSQAGAWEQGTRREGAGVAGALEGAGVAGALEQMAKQAGALEGAGVAGALEQMARQAGALEGAGVNGVTKDELRIFEDRLVRKLQTLISNKTF